MAPIPAASYEAAALLAAALLPIAYAGLSGARGYRSAARALRRLLRDLLVLPALGHPTALLTALLASMLHLGLAAAVAMHLVLAGAWSGLYTAPPSVLEALIHARTIAAWLVLASAASLLGMRLYTRLALGPGEARQLLLATGDLLLALLAATGAAAYKTPGLLEAHSVLGLVALGYTAALLAMSHRLRLPGGSRVLEV
ncbi:hypothetical protein CF15_01970 [Pyrodictium occultum]|uniref:Uncharacterized protein n=1 Tax=Pyrodictium occultum TaxID=2309 RepID=A0A0V8RU84_PYROC|nr:hypothetical protein [Pyrodictium occultum]KSW11620.1 hypothetical protein CF15_01970 [Pyrodictium occultum]